ncbi:MAG: TSUP family transporter, partial [Humibacillus sp.]
NVLALIVNLVAAAVFVLFARQHIDAVVVLLISAGSLVGGVIGARVGRRLPPAVLRGLIVVIGVVAVVKLVWFP